MVLKEGKYLNKDLAEWFGITPNSFNKQKDKKLEELKNFAQFHLDGKRVVIDKVFIEEYSKQGSQAYQQVRDKIDEVWDESGLDSCSRVGSEIYEVLSEDECFKLTEGSVYQYTIRGRNELYGKPFMDGGSMGNCKYLWCKKDNETGTYHFLTEEEQAIKQKLQTKYFGDATEKQILVKAMVEAGEITKEDAWDVLEEMTNMRTGNFMMFLKELQAELGCQVVKGTYIERNNTKGLEFRD